MSSIHEAARRNYVELVQELLDTGVSTVNERVSTLTPLHFAARGGSWEVAQLLLRRGADVNATEEEASHQKGLTPLHVACQHGHLQLVELLLQADGSDVNFQTINNNGPTPLHLAVTSHHLHIIRYLLLEQGADVTRTTTDEAVTALHLASGKAYANLDVVLVLLENGADPMARDSNGMAPIFHACIFNHVDIVRAFLDDRRVGPDLLVATANQQWTCLHAACSAGNLDVTRLLLNRGANLEARSIEDQRPLHLACFEGDLEVIRLLLEEGAEMEPMDMLFNLTPLGMAAFANRVEAVRLLLDRGANVVVNRNQHLSVLDVACRVGNLEVAELALDRVGIVEAETDGQFTPLYEAGSHNHLEIVWILVRRFPWLLAHQPT